ncbi:MAG: STAS domain-containing protein [Acidimicrobiia bacterium]
MTFAAAHALETGPGREEHVIRLPAEVHDADEGALRHALARVPAGRPLVVDLGRTELIGLAPLYALADTARRLRRGGHDVELRRTNRGIRSMLRATNSEHLFRLGETRQE